MRTATAPGSGTRRRTLLAAVPIGIVLVLASSAWACVSHTGPGTVDHVVVNVSRQQAASNTGCLVGRVPTVCAVPNRPAVMDVDNGDDMVSHVTDFTWLSASTSPGTPPGGTYAIGFGHVTCTAPGASESFPSPTSGPVFARRWTPTTVTVVSGEYYRACVLAPSGVPVVGSNVLMTGV